MTDKQTLALAHEGNTQKDSKDWVTGDEARTGAQRSDLTTLAEQAKQPVDAEMTKAEASVRIEEVQAPTGRGASEQHSS